MQAGTCVKNRQLAKDRRQVALREIEKQSAAGGAGNQDMFYVAKLQTARFYFAKLFPETATAMRTARTGARVLMDTDAVFA